MINSNYHTILDTLDVDFCLIKYEKGELVSSPFQDEAFFQIIEQGSINIYFIRDEAAPASLTERVMYYMKCKCDDKTLARQLQRILNQCEAAGSVKKLGKGTYKLI